MRARRRSPGWLALLTMKAGFLFLLRCSGAAGILSWFLFVSLGLYYRLDNVWLLIRIGIAL